MGYINVYFKELHSFTFLFRDEIIKAYFYRLKSHFLNSPVVIWHFLTICYPREMNQWLKNLLGHVTLPWMSRSIVPDRPWKSRFSHTQNALSSKRRLRTPTEGHTTAAQGDHGYDVRTLEADKPAVAGSAPLIWMFSKPSNADLNSRLWRCSARIPCCFHVRFIHHLSTRSVPLSQCWLSSL